MSAFADFVLARLANRADAFGRYLRGRTSTAKEPLTSDVVALHEAGEALIGLHALSGASTCLWVAWDLDNHSEDAGTAKTNLGAAEALCEAIRAQGGEPILEDSDGQGGYHVWAPLDAPVPGSAALAWAKALCPPGGETFPKQAAVGGSSPYGNWLRLPGRHPRRAHESRIRIPAGWLPWHEYPWDDVPLSPASIVPPAPKTKAPEGTERLAEYDDTIRAGTRNDILFRFGAGLRAKGAAEETILAALLSENGIRCKPPLDDDEVRKIARSAQRYEPGENGTPIPASSDREDVLRALNEALSQHNRVVRIARILRKGAEFSIVMADGRTAPVRDASCIRSFDRFADALLDASYINLDPKLRKSWTAIGQMIVDVVEEIDVETQNDETKGWLAAVQESAGAVVDIAESEDIDRVREHGRVPFLRRDGVIYALTQPLCARLRQAGYGRVTVREMAKRLADLGYVRTQLGVGDRDNQKRVKAWRANP